VKIRHNRHYTSYNNARKNQESQDTGQNKGTGKVRVVLVTSAGKARQDGLPGWTTGHKRLGTYNLIN